MLNKKTKWRNVIFIVKEYRFVTENNNKLSLQDRVTSLKIQRQIYSRNIGYFKKLVFFKLSKSYTNYMATC